MHRDEFYLSVAQALTGCQLVEQELKLHISEALALARHCVAGRFPFKLSGADYENASLERLIQGFRKFTSNDSLVSDLERFKDERNHLSHKGISHCLDFEGELDLPTSTEYANRLVAIQAEASRLRTAIIQETLSISAELSFGRQSDA